MYIQFHITECCNFKCKHCYQETVSNTMSIDNFKLCIDKIVDFLKMKGERNNVLSLIGGEPMVLPNFMEYFDYANKHIDKVGIDTNGSFLTPEICQNLKEKGISHIQVSLEGNKEINDYIRGDGSFANVTKNTKIAHDMGIYTTVSCTINKLNYNHIKDLYFYLKEHNISNGLWFDRMIPITDKLDIINTQEFKAFLKDLNDIVLDSKQNKDGVQVRARRALQNLNGIESNMPLYYCQACKMIIVLPNGDLLACRRMPITIGNIFEKDLRAIYNSPENLLLKSKISAIPQECKGCKYQYLCKGGLKCLSYAIYGDYSRKDINCPL